MGCDGGTIPTRGEQVKTKKRPEKISKEAELLTKWMHCAMSQEPLRQPIVACQLGNLYNKESVILHLLDRASKSSDPTVKISDKFNHIRSRKDFKDLKLSDNPAFSVDDAATKGGRNLGATAFVCPITGLEMNGHYRFSYILSCGCVLSERAITEISDNDSCCIGCGGKYTKDNVIPLNPLVDELERLKVRMEERRALELQAKKSKKGALGAVSASATSASADASASSGSESAGSFTADNIKCEVIESPQVSGEDHLRKLSSSAAGPSSSKKQKLSTEDDKLSVGQSFSTSAAAQDVKPTDVELKHKKASRPDSTQSHCKTELSIKRESSQDTGTTSRGQVGIGLEARAKLMSKGKEPKKPSIQQDTKLSATYKSLFNTHANALNQPKAHWVTYNPQYN